MFVLLFYISMTSLFIKKDHYLHGAKFDATVYFAAHSCYIRGYVVETKQSLFCALYMKLHYTYLVFLEECLHACLVVSNILTRYHAPCVVHPCVNVISVSEELQTPTTLQLLLCCFSHTGYLL